METSPDWPVIGFKTIEPINELFGRRHSLSIPLMDGERSLRFYPATAKADRPVVSFAVVFGDRRVSFEMSSLPFAAAKNFAPDFSGLSKELQESMLEYVFSPFLDLVEKSLGVEARIECSTESAAKSVQKAVHAKGLANPGIGFSLIFDGPFAETVIGHVLKNEEEIEDLLRLTSPLNIKENLLFDEVPVVLFAHAGYTTLDMREVSALECDDVILLDHQDDPDNISQKLFVPGKYVLSGIFEERNFIVDNIDTSPYETPYDNTQQSMDVNEVPLSLVFEAARVEITFGKLKEVMPGTVLRPDINPDAPLCIRANGKKIGTGTLVKIGDAMGVRILTIGSQVPGFEAGAEQKDNNE